MAINSAVSQQREAQIREALEQQREKILKLKEQRDEASVLLRDVESAQRAYEAINARLNQVAIEGQSNQTNVSIIKQAMPPSEPSSPRILVNMILAVMAGGMLAVIVGLTLEIRDRRLRTDFDVTELLELPVLGSIPARNKPEPRALPWRKKTATDTESRTLLQRIRMYCTEHQLPILSTIVVDDVGKYTGLSSGLPDAPWERARVFDYQWPVAP